MSDDRFTRLDTRAVVLLLLCCALWGLNNVATKFALIEVPPLMQAAFRSLGAALLLALWMLARGQRIWARDGTAAAGVLAGVLFAAEFGCMFVGLQYTAASRMTVFVYLAPFVVALGMPLIAANERLSASQISGLALAFAGVVWAFAEGFGSSRAAPLQWLGDALGIAGGVLWGATTLLVRGSRLNLAPPQKTLLYQLAVSAAALAAASFVAGESAPRSLHTSTVLAMTFQTVVVTFASYLTWFWLMRHYPATRVAAFTLLAPVFGLIAGVALLGEDLTTRIVTALLAVTVGMVLVNRPGQRAQVA